MKILLYQYFKPGVELKTPSARWRKTDIFCELIHYQPTQEQSSPQWRSGNVQSGESASWRFIDKHNLCLSVRACGPFPRNSFLSETDPTIDTGNKQWELIMAGTILYSQLSVAVVGKIKGD